MPYGQPYSLYEGGQEKINMNKNKYGYKYKLLVCTVLCSLLFCACEQETEPLQENAAALSETVEEKKKQKKRQRRKH